MPPKCALCKSTGPRLWIYCFKSHTCYFFKVNCRRAGKYLVHALQDTMQLLFPSELSFKAAQSTARLVNQRMILLQVSSVQQAPGSHIRTNCLEGHTDKRKKQIEIPWFIIKYFWREDPDPVLNYGTCAHVCWSRPVGESPCRWCSGWCTHKHTPWLRMSHLNEVCWRRAGQGVSPFISRFYFTIFLLKLHGPAPPAVQQLQYFIG